MTVAEAFLTFGLPTTANWEEVRRKYKEEVQAWHPDKFAPGSKMHERASDKMKALNEAREVLRVFFERQSGPRNGTHQRKAQSTEQGDEAGSVSILYSGEAVYLGGDPRLENSHSFYRQSSAYLVLVHNGLYMQSRSRHGNSERVSYSASEILGAVWHNEHFASLHRVLDYRRHECRSVPESTFAESRNQVWLEIQDPERIVGPFDVCLRLPNEYLAKLLWKRLREHHCPVNVRDALAYQRRSALEAQEERKRKRAEEQRRKYAEDLQRRRAESEERWRLRAAKLHRFASTIRNPIYAGIRSFKLPRYVTVWSTVACFSVVMIACRMLGIPDYLRIGVPESPAEVNMQSAQGSDTLGARGLNSDVRPGHNGNRDKSPENRKVGERSLWEDGVLAHSRGAYGIAIDHFQSAVNNDIEAPYSANNLAWLLATCPHDGLRDGAAAVKLASSAVKYFEPTSNVPWNFYGTLAAAHAENGDFQSAIIWQEECLKRCPKERVKPLYRRLKLYREGKPFRESSPDIVPREAVTSAK